MTKHKVFLVAKLMLLLPFLTQCNSFLDIPPSPQLIESEALLSNEATAQSAVNSVYTSMRSLAPSILNGAAAIFAGLAGDELKPSVENQIYAAFYQNTLTADNNTIGSNFWTPAYQIIFRCNALIEKLQENNALKENVRNRLLGELLTARALVNTYLVGFFGRIPLVLTSDYTINATLPQSEYNEVMLQVVDDLETARRYFGVPSSAEPKIRPSYWAATALLARISLEIGAYDLAVAYADEITNSGMYQLSSDLGNLFSIGNDETIWEIAPPYGTDNTPLGYAFISQSPNYFSPILLREELVNIFEPGDKRLTDWINCLEIDGTMGCSPSKYKHYQIGQTFEYLVVFRLAEQYLIRAEAHFMNGSYENALEDLNVIRSRAGLDKVSDLPTEGELWGLVVNERRRELFAEWGHRWFDIRRWGMLDDIKKGENPNWKSEYALFPIPEQQLNNNYNLIQNPGY